MPGLILVRIKLRTVVVAVIALAALATCYGYSRSSGAQPTPADTPGQPYRSNQRVVVEKDGSKTLHVRWAIGSPDTITTLRIPIAFATLVGTPFGPNYKDPDYQQPFSRTLLVQAALPDFSPLPRDRRWADEEGMRSVHILVESNIGLRPNKNEKDALRVRAKVRYEHLTLGHPFKIVDKPERFDLMCVGPAHDRSGPQALLLYDYCFSGASISDPDDFMTCTVLEVPTREEQPNFPGRPSCKHWFIVPGLSAVSKMTYARKYQKDWREIKRRATAFLESFLSN